MKNEEKIIELLTELVRKSDRHDELFAQHEERMKEYDEIIKQNAEYIRQNAERIRQNEERLNNQDEISAGVLTLLRDLVKRSGETDELRERIERLEKYTGLK